MTSLATKAALVAALLALAGCKDINAGMNLLEGKPEDAQPIALAAFDLPAPVSSIEPLVVMAAAVEPEPIGPPPEEGIDWLLDWGLTDDGAYYATGWNCTNVPGYRKCAGNMRKPN